VKRFTVDARSVESFEDFVEAFNRGFVEHVGGTWNGNLDGFNDFLSWPQESHYELELLGSEASELNLGYPAQAAWLRGNLETCHPSNRRDVEARLALAEAGRGETLFDVLKEIIESHSEVRLILS
jgi:hypothetical protein